MRRWLPRGLVLVDGDGRTIRAFGRHPVGPEVPSLEAILAEDRLTGLPTRWEFQHALVRELSRAARGDVERPSVAMLDLDGLKPLNDEFGHNVGDEILAAVGRRIAATVRDADLVARLGGDEFACLLPVTDLDAAGEVLRRVLEEIERPIETSAGELSVTASIGVATATEHHLPSGHAMLLSWADHAAYYAKATGGGRVELARRAMLQELVDERRRLSREAMTDARTGLGNVRAYELALAGIHERASEHGERYAAVLLDLDHFHAYNRALSLEDGHAALRAVAEVLVDLVGESRAFRYGGEEFVALVPEAEATRVAEGLVAGVRALALSHPGRDDGIDHLTVTVGVSRWQPGDKPDAPVVRADHATVRGKETGRDRVVDADVPDMAP